jgi:hypothetical protein
MAVEVFKNGRSALVDPKNLQNHLQAGWSLEESPKEPEPVEPEAEALGDAASPAKRRGRPRKGE